MEPQLLGLEVVPHCLLPGVEIAPWKIGMAVLRAELENIVKCKVSMKKLFSNALKTLESRYKMAPVLETGFYAYVQ